MQTRERAVLDQATGLRLVGRNNYTQRREQFIVSHAQPLTTLADVAIALDLCADETTERRGNSGIGAGCRVEVVFDNEDPASEETPGEEITSLNSPVVARLPLGEGRRLRQFIHGQRRASVWNGSNHTTACSVNSEQLLARIRYRPQ